MVFFKKFPSPIVLCWYIVKKLTLLVPGVFAITVVGSLVFSSYIIISSSLVAKMVKVSAYNAGDPGSIPGSGRSPGEGDDNPL